MSNQPEPIIFESSTKKVQRVCILEVDKNYTVETTYTHAPRKSTVPVAHKSNTASTFISTERHNGEESAVPQISVHDTDDVLKTLDPSISVETCYLRPNVRRSIATIRRKQHDTDLFINLYDLADETGRKIIEYMEEQGLAFTGVGSRFYDPTRMQLKRVCYSCDGIFTPPFFFLFDLKSIETVAVELDKFPLFVKPEHGYDSVGIDEKSVVYNVNELKTRAEHVLEEFGGVLVEQYIDGREFSVLVAGSKYSEIVTFPPVEYRFAANRQPNNPNSTGPAFITLKDKWGRNYSYEDKWHLIDEKENDLRKELMDIAIKLYQSFDGEGLARFDIRQEAKTKVLYVLDINPNPSVFYKDGSTAEAIICLTGWTKSEFMQFLINHALVRQTRFHSLHGYIVKRTESKGYGLYAARDLKKGDLIYSDEEQPVRLVTRQYVTENYNEMDKRCFDLYAWPLGSEIYALWDLDLTKTKPLNHSCDPNMLMNGLRYIARRDITYGEELTMDYATFAPSHSFSQCWCGAALCRKTIQPNEYREEWFQKRYGTYVSPYVRTLIEIEEMKKAT